jgi:hypothetical protein
MKLLGIAGTITDIEEGQDRIWAKPIGSVLFDYIVQNGWTIDFIKPSLLHEGAKTSYREPNAVMPALQVCFLDNEKVEIDLDFANPIGGDVASLVVHAFEVGWHWIRRTKTNPVRMSKAIDKRFRENG